ncbi:glycosyltransferase [Aquiflexum sp. LQ15W]|uniref:glycosyltransferase family 2 protein n=1 Tax=Cognataquiflexum nitidum TaxID=2922272 RepID=UPI001F1361E4|nr:glycosyltransferase family 2 protein [Cognataquiflexum nitidum]MCH6202122.1 glycosyltransferase [Cognataquiflexum nitidum]
MVSVIIPVFNNKSTLERALSSVINETEVLEVFIVDDGSTDGSIILAEQFATKYENIKFLHHPYNENRGATASRNLGLSKASSEWIQFLDADDELLPDKLAGQLKLTLSGISMVVGNSIHVYPNGRMHYRKSDNNIWKGLIRSKLGDTCANLWHRQSLIKVGGWDEKLSSSQEYDMMFRLVSDFPNVVFDNRYLTLIHKTENSISTNPNKKEQRMQNWIALRQRIRIYLVWKREFGIKNQYNWSGAVGLFCDINVVEYPAEISMLFYRIYKLELEIKKILHQITKR